MPKIEIMKPREAAEVLKISEKTLYNITAPRGTLESIKIGAARRYTEAALRNYIARQTQSASSGVAR